MKVPRGLTGGRWTWRNEILPIIHAMGVSERISGISALNWVIVNYSWHHAFGVLGIVGLLWVFAWLALDILGYAIVPRV